MRLGGRRVIERCVPCSIYGPQEGYITRARLRTIECHMQCLSVAQFGPEDLSYFLLCLQSQELLSEIQFLKHMTEVVVGVSDLVDLATSRRHRLHPAYINISTRISHFQGSPDLSETLKPAIDTNLQSHQNVRQPHQHVHPYSHVPHPPEPRCAHPRQRPPSPPPNNPIHTPQLDNSSPSRSSNLRLPTQRQNCIPITYRPARELDRVGEGKRGSQARLGLLLQAPRLPPPVLARLVGCHLAG
jgi:hypothetical protein